MITAIKINKIVKTNAVHALYRENGTWYHHLRKFPGVLFDSTGFLLFTSQDQYLKTQSLQHGDELNIKNGISSIEGYKKFTKEQLAKIASLKDNHQLDVSDSAWRLFLSHAKKAKENDDHWYSPKHDNGYSVKSIAYNKIVVKKEKGSDSELGQRFFVARLYEINQNAGVIKRIDFPGRVAQMSAIVHLHPLLQWSKDNETIIVKNKVPKVDRQEKLIPSKKKSISNIVKEDLDSQADENSDIFEGGPSKKRLISYFERRPKLRARAIKFHGTQCKICEFDFKKYYGIHGADYIEVHHLVPIHKLVKSTKIDHEKDMIVVCANCHRMIHRKKLNPLSIAEIKKLWADNKKLREDGKKKN